MMKQDSKLVQKEQLQDSVFRSLAVNSGQKINVDPKVSISKKIRVRESLIQNDMSCKSLILFSV